MSKKEKISKALDAKLKGKPKKTIQKLQQKIDKDYEKFEEKAFNKSFEVAEEDRIEDVDYSGCCGAKFNEDSDLCPKCSEHTGREL